jgi:predicted nucleic acid-binding protein
MDPLFVDTSAWYPLADSSHSDHEPLAAVLRERVQAGARIVTTNLVLAETHALLMRRAGREAALRFTRTVRQPPNVVEYSTLEREESALSDWLERFDDQRFSLTDAVSFVVMAELEIRDALALDQHFATAGFAVISG